MKIDILNRTELTLNTDLPSMADEYWYQVLEPSTRNELFPFETSQI